MNTKTQAPDGAVSRTEFCADAIAEAVKQERMRYAVLRAMAQQVVDADDAHELTQQKIDLLRAALITKDMPPEVSESNTEPG